MSSVRSRSPAPTPGRFPQVCLLPATGFRPGKLAVERAANFPPGEAWRRRITARSPSPEKHMRFEKVLEYKKLRDAFCSYLHGEPGTKISHLPEELEAGVDYKAWYGKYVDWEKCLRDASHTALRLKLHLGPPLRILDIGCGPGYFAWVCSHYGHHVTGLDFPGPYFARFRALLDVECVEKPVCKWATLPVDETGFDWIVSRRHAVSSRRVRLWRRKEDVRLARARMGFFYRRLPLQA